MNTVLVILSNPVVILLIGLILWMLLTKPKDKNILYCGLFGGVFNRSIDDNILKKLKTLGLFNQSRGTDSCGVFDGFDIVKGVDKEKAFMDFVLNERITLPQYDSRVWIGHTRQATWGAHTLRNAHPFNINNRLILAHNGTLENIWSLCTEQGIPTKGVDVDSEGLGLLFDKIGKEALEKYKGAAALLMHKLGDDTPNHLYIFHGASKKFQYSAELTEERPLFYYQAEEGIYISSLKHALEWIHGKADNELIKEVPHNQLIKLVDGEFTEDIIDIDREEANIYVYKPTTSETNSKVGKSTTAPVVILGCNNNLPIEKERLPLRAFGNTNGIYYWKGRYYRTQGSGQILCQGLLYLNKSGEIVSPDDRTQKKVEPYFFYDGVMIKTESRYKFIMEQITNCDSEFYRGITYPNENFAKWMSHHSRFPVTNIGIESEKLVVNRELWYLDGKFADVNSITPKFSDRNYHIKNGKLVKVVSAKADSPFLASSENKDNENKAEQAKQNELPFRRDVKEDNLPKEVVEALDSLRTIYLSEYEADSDIKGIPYFALEKYAEDLCEDVLGVEATSDLVEKIISETILSAVYQSKNIEDVLDPQCNTLVNYVYEAWEDWKEDSESEVDIDEGIMDKVDGVDGDIFKKEEDDAILETAGESCMATHEPKKVPLTQDSGFSRLYNIEDEEIKAQEDEEAKDYTEDVLKLLKDIRTKAKDLEMLTSSTFAIEVSGEILMYSEQILSGIKESCRKHGLNGIVAEIKNIINIY